MLCSKKIYSIIIAFFCFVSIRCAYLTVVFRLYENEALKAQVKLLTVILIIHCKLIKERICQNTQKQDFFSPSARPQTVFSAPFGIIV